MAYQMKDFMDRAGYAVDVGNEKLPAKNAFGRRSFAVAQFSAVSTWRWATI